MKLISLIIMFTFSFQLMALTKEEIKAIEKRNAEAMQRLYNNQHNKEPDPIPSNVETKPVTDKQFRSTFQNVKRSKINIPSFQHHKRYFFNLFTFASHQSVT